MKKITLLIIIYLIIYWIGFKSGEIFHRMKNKVTVEGFMLPDRLPEK